MKLWKSPVFYFGIVLAMAVVALLVAPFVVDWNSYRADLENYGRKLTGRDVKIEGEIAARLFPWPRLTVDDIHVANPPGLSEAEFARAERIVVRMTLGGLFQGNIDVESIEIERPVVAFERLASGDGNWHLKPAADLVRSELLDRVKLDRISLKNGVVKVADRRRGEAHQLDDFNATLSAPGVAGPWRMRAVGLYAGQAVEIGINTATWKDGEPFRFGFRVSAADGSGPAFAFDGGEVDGRVEGNVRVEPAAATAGKTDAEGRFRPLIVTARVKASYDDIAFEKIEIAPADAQSGGTLLGGTASLKLGKFITATADLQASMLDLDELAGAEARTLLRESGVLAFAHRFLELLPSELRLTAGLRIAALKTGGETLDTVVLSVDAIRDAIRIKELSSSLPGRSRVLFTGVFFPGNGSSELAGSLAVESSDARKLVSWVWPEGQDQIGKTWTGSRGRFKMQTEVSVTPSRLRLVKTQYELDGEQGTGEFSFVSGGRGSADIRLTAKRLDIDSFILDGGTAIAAGNLEGALRFLVPHKDSPDVQIKVQADELLLNGVTAKGLVLDAAAGGNGLDLRALEIGSVGGARLEATGLILDNGQGPDGSIGVKVKADDPRELLRLMGLSGSSSDPVWATQLGKTELSGDIFVKTQNSKTVTSIDASATADGLTASLTGAVDGASALELVKFSGTASIKTGTSHRLVQLAGLQAPAGDGESGELTVTAAGTLRDGFTTDLQLKAFGGRLDYSGLVRPSASGIAMDGKLALRATDAMPLAAALGLPVPLLPAGQLVLDSAVTAKEGSISLPDVTGRIGSARITGDFSLDKGMKVSGNLSTGAFALRDLLATLFLDWTGAAPDLETAFAPGLPFGLTGEIWITPAALTVHDQFTAKDVQIGITASDGEIRLAMFGKDEDSRDAHIEIGSKGTEGSRQVDGRISIPVDLGNQLRLAGGSPIAEGRGNIEVEFAASGRSPGGALAALKGTGSYDVEGLKLFNLSPGAFSRLLGTAQDSAGLVAAFDALRGGDGLQIGKAIGNVHIENGVATFQPIVLASPDADVDVKVVGELALGALDASIGIKLKARAGLPPMSIAYAGPPMALARSEDNSELATSLGVTLMQRGVDELERLQKEQERLAIEEEKQRVADEAKLAAYYAQRDELLLRKRELKVHAEMRVIEAERLRLKLEAERAANLEINKTELKQRQREIRVHRRLARLQRASSTVVPEPAPQPSKPRKAKSQAAKPRGPVILAQPEGAPVIISPVPGSSPSQ